MSNSNHLIKFIAVNKETKQMFDCDDIILKLHGLILPSGRGMVSKDRESELYEIDEKYDLYQYSGLSDKDGEEIYADHILKGERGEIFRIYHTAGGFVMKDSIWRKDMNDLSVSDQLVVMPLSDPQTASYIHQCCKIIGHYATGYTENPITK